MEKFAIIAGGGTGQRMSAQLPKQFHLIMGKPVIVHAVLAFVNAMPDVKLVVVIHPSWIEYFEKHCLPFLPPDAAVASGGETRFHSVRNGLSKIKSNTGLVAVHDAARPMVSKRVILDGFKLAEKKGSAVPVIIPQDSLRMISAESTIAVDRNEYRLIQTPQIFPIISLRAAYAQEFNQIFTDDATVVEKSGIVINTYEGDKTNIKITIDSDLEIAKALFGLANSPKVAN